MHQKKIYIYDIALQRIAESNKVPWGKKHKPLVLYYSIDFLQGTCIMMKHQQLHDVGEEQEFI